MVYTLDSLMSSYSNNQTILRNSVSGSSVILTAKDLILLGVDRSRTLYEGPYSNRFNIILKVVMD